MAVQLYKNILKIPSLSRVVGHLSIYYFKAFYNGLQETKDITIITTLRIRWVTNVLLENVSLCYSMVTNTISKRIDNPRQKKY